MRRLSWCVWLVLALLAPVARAADSQVEAVFEESDGLLLNPDSGWIAYNYEDSYDLRRRAAGGKEPFAFASAVYTRHPRKAWQDADGSFENSAPLRLLEDWIAHKRHVAFRIYANGPSDLPDDVRKPVSTFRIDADGKAREAIRYWDDAYIADHRRLVQFLGERLGESPYLAFVDIGGVGDTGGEWCFTSQQSYASAGLNDDVMLALTRTFIEMYEEAFPDVRLVISYECAAKAGRRFSDVVALLKERGIGVRDDGLGGWPYQPRRAPPVEVWPVPLFWRDVPVVFEGGGRGGGVYGWRLQGKDPKAVLDWAFAQCRPSLINLGGAETNSEKACAELAPLLVEYGRRLGYRFVLLKATLPVSLRRGQEAELTMRWANRGIARSYADRPLEVSFFRDTDELVAFVEATMDLPTTRWAPESELAVQALFTTPKTLAPGDYVVKLRLLRGDPRAPSAFLQIATKGADAQGRYTLGRVSVRDE